MAIENGSVLVRTLFDAIPAFVFAVDEDVRVLEYNREAAALVGPERSTVLMRRGGDVMHCLHSTNVSEGCGRGPACRDCVNRNAVREALHGDGVVRRRVKLELARDGRCHEIQALLSVSPFDHDGTRMAILVIEDISELAELQRMLPICARCKRIRDDDEYWERVELYLSKHYDMVFTHGLCPECLSHDLHRIDEGVRRRRFPANPD